MVCYLKISSAKVISLLLSNLSLESSQDRCRMYQDPLENNTRISSSLVTNRTLVPLKNLMRWGCTVCFTTTFYTPPRTAHYALLTEVKVFSF